MNRSGSHPYNENLNAWWGRVVIYSLNHRRAPLLGEATLIIYEGMGVLTPIIITKRDIFHGKSSFSRCLPVPFGM